MFSMKKVVMFLLAMFMLQVSAVAGSKKINFQGKVTNSGGGEINNSNQTIYFKLYPASTGGNSVWSLQLNGINVVKSLFNVTLTGGQPDLDTVAFNQPYWLSMSLDGVNELLPRQELGASGYALGSLNDFNVKGKLQIDGDWVSNIGQLYVNNPGTNNGHSYINVNSVSNAESGYMISKAGTPMWSIYQPSMGNGSILRIEGNGNVGIGAAMPGAKLQIDGNYVANKGQLYVNNPGTVNGHCYIIVNSIYAAEGGYGISKSGTQRWWIYQPTNYDDLRIESETGARMTIQKGGNVGIGINPQHTLDVQGDICSRTGTWVNSDERIKKNIEIVSTGVLGKVKNINAIKYNLNKDEMKKMKFGVTDMAGYEKKITEEVMRMTTDTVKIPILIAERKRAEENSLNFCDETQLGVKAQELEIQFPELVKTDSNGYKAVAYDKLAVVLLEAIKEQQVQIEALKNEITNLNNKKVDKQ